MTLAGERLAKVCLLKNSNRYFARRRLLFFLPKVSANCNTFRKSLKSATMNVKNAKNSDHVIIGPPPFPEL